MLNLSVDKILCDYVKLNLVILKLENVIYEEMLKVLGEFIKSGVIW